MKLVLASKNQHKLKEMQTILGQLGLEVVLESQVGVDVDVDETGVTFMENALKKAREIAEIAHCPALADDSGITAEALGNEPGVYSARFCGRHGDDAANNALLLERLSDKEDKRAHYTAAMALVYPDGREITAEGYMHGHITPNARGERGFGYDPIFYFPSLGKTFSEISQEEKNKISHRANALELFAEKIGELC